MGLCPVLPRAPRPSVEPEEQPDPCEESLPAIHLVQPPTDAMIRVVSSSAAPQPKRPQSGSWEHQLVVGGTPETAGNLAGVVSAERTR